MKQIAADQLYYWVSIAGVIMGVALWLSAVDNKATASVQGVQDLQTQVRQDQQQFEEIRARLIRIEDKLDKN